MSRKKTETTLKRNVQFNIVYNCNNLTTAIQTRYSINAHNNNNIIKKFENFFWCKYCIPPHPDDRETRAE